MLESSEEDSKDVLAMSRRSDCSHYLINNHDSLFYSQVDAANSTVGLRTKYNCMSISAMKAHFVEDDRDVFHLKIV